MPMSVKITTYLQFKNKKYKAFNNNYKVIKITQPSKRTTKTLNSEVTTMLAIPNICTRHYLKLKLKQSNNKSETNAKPETI